MGNQPLRILLADDSRVTQAAVRHVLGGQGHRLDIACTGLEALSAIESEDYDAILMDIWMPQMDGLEATRRLCKSWPSPSRPPIIALTAATSPEMRESCFRLGMDEFLAKPVRGSVLIEVVRRLGLRGREARLREEEALQLLHVDGPGPPPENPILDVPTEVVVDGMLGRLRIWTEEEWALLPEPQRPKTATYCKGLGWVGVVPRLSLN
jgi:CheY-like chemotaxis protein